jgi:oligosaccharide repeat unit polymerase
MNTQGVFLPIPQRFARFSPALQVILLGALCLLAVLGLLVPSYGYSALVGMGGIVLSVAILALNLVRFLRTRENLGLFMLSLGSVFWFWGEVFGLLASDPVFPNVASYAPFREGQIPQGVLAKSLVAVALFNLTAFATLLLTGRMALKLPTPHLGERACSAWVDIALVLFALAGWFPFLQTFGGFQQALANMLLMRSETVEFEASLVNYLPILSISSASYALVRLATGSCGSRLIALLAVLVGAPIAVLSGTRFKLLYLLLPAVLAHALYPRGKRTSTLRTILVSIVLAGSMLALATYQFANRYGSQDDIELITAAVWGAGHFTALTHAVALMEDRWIQPFMQPMAPLFVTDYVPRFIWPDKPMHEYWEFYNTSLVYAGNITPSVVGQYYLNWGWIGAAISGVIFGLWARVGDVLLERFRLSANHLYLALAVFVFAFLFLSYRVYSPNYFTYPLVMLVFFQVFGRRLVLRRAQHTRATVAGYSESPPCRASHSAGSHSRRRISSP